MFGRRAQTDSAQPARKGLLNRLLSRFMLFTGFISLSYLLGAAVIYFDLPTSNFLRRGFGGAVAWYEAKPIAQNLLERATPVATGKIDRPEKTCDGFTLLMYGGDSRAILINMLGETIHQWHIPFSEVWPNPKHLRGRIDNATVYFNDGFIYPNGDLVVVVEGPINASNSSNGYGLIKLDKDSRLIWKYAEHCHHDVAVGDDGRIYAIVSEVVEKLSPGLDYIPTPCMVDDIDILSPEGKQLKRVRILEAFQNSQYAPILGIYDRPNLAAVPVRGTGPSAPMFRQEEIRRDVLHTNAVKVLGKKASTQFPLFREGQILISPRQLDAIAVIDPENEKVVWAARGPWHAQHDPSFLDNGNLLLFDNLGSPKSSRVLELNPRTMALPWFYPGESGLPFVSPIRGMCQRLSNGNTFIVNSVGCEAIETTSQNEIVWSCSTGSTTLNRARRYSPEQLDFIKDSPRAPH